MLDPLALDLLLLALTNDRYRRRLSGRLRPRLSGRPHPQLRLQRLRVPLLRRWSDPVSTSLPAWNLHPITMTDPPRAESQLKGAALGDEQHPHLPSH